MKKFFIFTFLLISTLVNAQDLQLQAKEQNIISEERTNVSQQNIDTGNNVDLKNQDNPIVSSWAKTTNDETEKNTITPNQSITENQNVNPIIETTSISNTNSLNKSSSNLLTSTNDKRFVKISLIVVVGCFIVLIILGMTNRVVIFFNWTDFYVTLGIFLSLVIGLLISGIVFDDDPMMQDITIYTSIASATVFGIATIYFSIKHNKNIILGLIIGILKVLISVFSALILFAKILEVTNSDKSLSDKFSAAVVIAGIIWFLHAMINGEEVYERRGWDFPSK